MSATRDDKQLKEYYQKIKSNLSTLNIQEITQQMSAANSFMYEMNGDVGGNAFHYSIYRCPVDKNNPQERFYLVDREFPAIGKGGFGTVHEAYALNITKNDLRRLKSNSQKKQVEEVMRFAIKIIQHKSTKINDLRETEEKIEKEMEIFNNFYKAERPVKLQESPAIFFIVMEYIPGYELNIIHPHHHTTDNDKYIQDFIKNASFQTRINLIREMAWSLNTFHHNTPLTGNTVIHRDLKGANFKILPHESSDVIFFDVSVIDTGSSLTDPDFHDSAVFKHDHHIEGTSLYMRYMSPEAYQGNTSVKSDIYSMTPLFAAILGARNPLKYKEHHLHKLSTKNVGKKLDLREMSPIAGVEFCFEEMLSEVGLVLPELNWTIQPINRFLQRMQHIDAAVRPSTDENISFFTALSEACSKTADLIATRSDAHLDFGAPILTTRLFNSIMEDKAKIFLLAAGLWDTPIGQTYVPHFTIVEVETKFEKDKEGNLIDVTPYKKNRRNEFLLDEEKNKIKETVIIEGNPESQVKTFKDYVFSCNPDVCEAIVALNNNNLLDANPAKRLAQTQTLLPQYIVALEARQQLTAEHLSTLITPRPIHFTYEGLSTLRKLVDKCKTDFDRYSPSAWMKKPKKEQRKTWRDSIMNKIKEFDYPYSNPTFIQSFQYDAAQKVLFMLKDVKNELESEHAGKNTSKGDFTTLINKHIKSLELELIRLTLDGRGFPTQATQSSSTSVIYSGINAAVPKISEAKRAAADTLSQPGSAPKSPETVNPINASAVSPSKHNEKELPIKTLEMQFGDPNKPFETPSINLKKQ
ncbi:MAG: protein kinase [Gammaproteobacteria bacterium]